MNGFIWSSLLSSMVLACTGESIANESSGTSLSEVIDSDEHADTIVEKPVRVTQTVNPQPGIPASDDFENPEVGGNDVEALFQLVKQTFRNDAKSLIPQLEGKTPSSTESSDNDALPQLRHLLRLPNGKFDSLITMHWQIICQQYDSSTESDTVRESLTRENLRNFTTFTHLLHQGVKKERGNRQ